VGGWTAVHLSVHLLDTFSPDICHFGAKSGILLAAKTRPKDGCDSRLNPLI
jgi:hypothetical protein